ncbi:MAG: molybdopterin-guanine dinucleotide biosynthesis protein B [Alphaproteobacteria bacterium]
MKVYGIIGWKNSGKTSLMERLVAEITARGLSVSTVKHVHHDVDLDQPGKDTYRHRAAGAREVVLASAQRFALLHEHRGSEPALTDILHRLAPVDLVLVEGYKRDPHPKIEVFRAETGHALIQPSDPTTRAVATDTTLPHLTVPVLDLNDTGTIADFILGQTGLHPAIFDTVVIVDWSAASTISPDRPVKDAIWIGVTRDDTPTTTYHRTRHAAEQHLTALLDAQTAAGRRTLLGFDFALAYPTGFAQALTGHPDPRAVWHWLHQHITDGPDNANNRFAVADRINARFQAAGPLWGPFWGRPATQPHPHLSTTKDIDYPSLGLKERRMVEGLIPATQPVWKLYTTGAVGSQSLMGLPLIHRLAQRPATYVWPFDAAPPPTVISQTATAQTVIAEVYPSLLATAVKSDPSPIKDEAQVRLLSRALWRLSRHGKLAPLFETPAIAAEEGWILGAGHMGLLALALE